MFDSSLLDATTNQYILTIGSYDLSNFKAEGKDMMIYVLFIIATFITQITFLNMLIAIMGDTFDRVSEIQ